MATLGDAYTCPRRMPLPAELPDTFWDITHTLHTFAVLMLFLVTYCCALYEREGKEDGARMRYGRGRPCLCRCLTASAKTPHPIVPSHTCATLSGHRGRSLPQRRSHRATCATHTCGTTTVLLACRLPFKTTYHFCACTYFAHLGATCTARRQLCAGAAACVFLPYATLRWQLPGVGARCAIYAFCCDTGVSLTYAY